MRGEGRDWDHHGLNLPELLFKGMALRSLEKALLVCRSDKYNSKGQRKEL